MSRQSTISLGLGLGLAGCTSPTVLDDSTGSLTVASLSGPETGSETDSDSAGTGQTCEPGEGAQVSFSISNVDPMTEVDLERYCAATNYEPTGDGYRISLSGCYEPGSTGDESHVIDFAWTGEGVPFDFGSDYRLLLRQDGLGGRWLRLQGLSYEDDPPYVYAIASLLLADGGEVVPADWDYAGAYPEGHDSSLCPPEMGPGGCVWRHQVVFEVGVGERVLVTDGDNAYVAWDTTTAEGDPIGWSIAVEQARDSNESTCDTPGGTTRSFVYASVVAYLP